MSTQWPQKRLGEVVSLDATTARADELSERDLYVGLENIASDGSLIGLGQVSAADLKSNKNRFDEGSVLFGKLRPYLAKVVRPETSGVCSTDILVLAPSSEIDRNYLYWWLRSPAVIEEATSKSTGATLPRISPSTLASFQIPVPPLAEQQRIVAKLDGIYERCRDSESAASSSAGHVLDLYTSGCRKLFQSLTRVAEVPLGDVLDLIIDHRGKTPAKLGGKFVTEGVPVISAIHIKGDEIKWDERDRFVTQSMFERWMPERLRTGDVLLTSEAPLGQVARIESDDPLVLSQRLFALRANEATLDPNFLFEFLRSPLGQERLHERSTGATAVGIRQSELLKVLVPLPSLRKQAEIAAELTELRDLVAKSKSVRVWRARKVSDLRQSVLEAAFRGEL